ncbi:3489_t:CDS:2, partial [Ambispora leptoticha]
MVMCEKCQRNSAEVELTEEGTQKTSLLYEWQKSLTITEKDGKKIKVCSGCKNKGGDGSKKCANCQTLKKPNELLTIQDQGKEIKICANCKQKRDNEPPPREDNQLPPKGSCAKCKKRCEMFAKNSQDLGKNNIHCPKCGKDLTGKRYSIISTTPFGKYSDEKEPYSRVSCGSDCPAEKAEREAKAKEIRDIQEKYKSATDFLSQLKDKLLNPREGATAYNLPNSDKAFVKYLSKEDARQAKEKLTPLLTASEKEKDLVLGFIHWLSYKVKYCDQTGYYDFADNLTGFLAECDEVLADKVISQEPQKLQKVVKEEISNDFFNATEDKQKTEQLETWQCPTCKLEITNSELNNKNHQCLKCSKCGKYSSYNNLSLHELYECSASQSNPLNKPTQQIINQQLTLLNQLATTLSQLSLNLQGLVNSISNNPNLNPQQKQQALSDVNTNLTDLQNIKKDIDGKLERLRSFKNQTSNNPNKPNEKGLSGGVITLIVVGGVVL